MKLKPWHDTLIETLKYPQDAAEYLNTALEEGDEGLFLSALKNVAQARGGMRKMARITNLNRSNLHKMLSKGGNPEIQTLTHLLDVFGLRLAVATKNSGKNHPRLKRAA